MAEFPVMSGILMNYKTEFATDEDSDALEALFLEYNLGLAGEIEEHVLLKKANEIIAGALIAAQNGGMFHLAVFAVASGKHNQGLGSQFLRELIRNPQKHCLAAGELFDRTFQITTVARGTASHFYKKNGFVDGSFADLDYPYSVQCDECPDREECDPYPMVFYSYPNNVSK